MHEVLCKKGDLVTLGQVLAKAQEPSPELDALRGEHTTLNPKNCTLTANIYGRVESDQPIQVKPFVKIDPHSMQATLDIFGTGSDGTLVTVDAVLAALTAAGVIVGHERATIEEALLRAQTQKRETYDLVVARGRPSTSGEDASLNFEFTVAGKSPNEIDSGSHQRLDADGKLALQFVPDGALLCVKTPVVKAEVGKNVLGKDLPPAAGKELRDVQVAAGKGTKVGATPTQFVCNTPVGGYADFIEGKVTVHAPLRVASDRMTALLTVYPPLSDGAGLTRAHVDGLIALAKVSHGIDTAAIDDALARAARGEVVKDYVIASGTPTDHGRDAQLVLAQDFHTTKQVGALKDDGSINFQERTVLVSVKRGELICRKLKATVGNPGMDVLGKVLTPTRGKDIQFKAGVNVEVAEDGESFSATADGVVQLARDGVSVTDLYVVRGDVGMETGHVRSGTSSMSVRGSVLADFEVESDGHISIQGAVENGKVTAGGDIDCKGGFVTHHQVSAGGTIKTRLAENTRLHAGHDLHIHDYALNCAIVCGGHLRVKGGHGSIIGGSVQARSGIEVQQLGSDAGVPTEVRLGAGLDEIQAIETEIAQLHAHVAEINMLIGTEWMIEDFGHFPPDERSIVEEVFAWRTAALYKVDLLREAKQHILDEARSKDAGEVRVFGKVFPGTRVSILTSTYEFFEPHENVRLVFDPKIGGVAVRSA